MGERASAEGIGKGGNLKMLLKAERIISYDDVLMDKSQDEIYDIVRRDLARRIMDECISKGLLKVEIVNALHHDFGSIQKVRASLRAYNPDN